MCSLLLAGQESGSGCGATPGIYIPGMAEPEAVSSAVGALEDCWVVVVVVASLLAALLLSSSRLASCPGSISHMNLSHPPTRSGRLTTGCVCLAVGVMHVSS